MLNYLQIFIIIARRPAIATALSTPSLLRPWMTRLLIPTTGTVTRRNTNFMERLSHQSGSSQPCYRLNGRVLARIGRLPAGCLATFLMTATLLSSANAAPAPQLDNITAKLKNGQTVTLATFGDSITWPCFHTDYRQNYITFAVDALRLAYPRADIRIVHAGNMGTTGRGLNKTRFERYVLAYQPDLVFIMFGMNDCTGGKNKLELFTDQLTRLIQKTSDSGATPVICTQNEILYDSPSGKTRKSLPLYMARALEVARHEKVTAVDCFADWSPLKSHRDDLIARLNDSIHPNHAGHRLMASSLLKTLWPEAVKHLSTEIATPEPLEKRVFKPRLLPGPTGKQVLRTAQGFWCTLSGRYHGEHGRDLVFSWSAGNRPTWDEFQHITLVGTPGEAVFDHMDRPLTSGMLLEHEGRIHILFGWKVGIFMLTIDPALLASPPTPKNLSPLARPATWLAHTNQRFVRPSEVLNANYRPGGILYDAFLRPGVWPYVVCRFLKKSPDTGSEVVKGEDAIALVTRENGPDTRQLDLLAVSPGFLRLITTPDGQHHYLTQDKPGNPIQVGTIGSSERHHVDYPIDQVIVPTHGQHPVAVLRKTADSPAKRPVWMRLVWGTTDLPRVVELPFPETSLLKTPLPWSAGSTDGITWQMVAPATDGPPPFRYSSRLPPGQRALGILKDDHGRLSFEVVNCEDSRP